MPCSESQKPYLHVPTSRRILFGHGFHPGEPNMEELYNYFVAQEPEDGLDNIIMSPEDWRLKRRLFEGRENLNALTPDHFGTRAQRLLARYCMQAQQYDIVIQPHGSALPNSDLAVYSRHTTPYTKQVASYLGFSSAIIRDEGAEGSLSNSLGIEIASNSPLLDFGIFHKRITSLLSENAHLPQAPPIDEYLFVANVTSETASRYDLRSHYEPLEPLTPHDTQVIHRLIGSDALHLVAFGWDQVLYEAGGFRGELLARLSMPASQFAAERRDLNI